MTEIKSRSKGAAFSHRWKKICAKGIKKKPIFRGANWVPLFFWILICAVLSFDKENHDSMSVQCSPRLNRSYRTYGRINQPDAELLQRSKRAKDEQRKREREKKKRKIGESILFQSGKQWKYIANLSRWLNLLTRIERAYFWLGAERDCFAYRSE